ncbi:MAG: hypothetical protein ACREFB_12105, partial [Stellaceae bacterium]
ALSPAIIGATRRGEERIMPHDPEELRDLAAWYREFAERAENPVIWDSRLRTAEKFERDADRIATECAARDHAA